MPAIHASRWRLTPNHCLSHASRVPTLSSCATSTGLQWVHSIRLYTYCQLLSVVSIVEAFEVRELSVPVCGLVQWQIHEVGRENCGASRRRNFVIKVMVFGCDIALLSAQYAFSGLDLWKSAAVRPIFAHHPSVSLRWTLIFTRGNGALTRSAVLRADMSLSWTVSRAISWTYKVKISALRCAISGHTV